MGTTKGIAQGHKPKVRTEVVTNWWTKETDDMDSELIKRIDYNARRRIDTKIDKGATYGNENENVDGVSYECHWRLVTPKNY